jgi:hypothetical protein
VRAPRIYALNAEMPEAEANSTVLYPYAGEDLAWWTLELGRRVEPGFFGEWNPRGVRHPA